MTNLITTPTFTFKQGEPYEEGYEHPIQVTYYNDDIVGIESDNGEVLISKQYAKSLFRAINKHWEEANSVLNRKEVMP